MPRDDSEEHAQQRALDVLDASGRAQTERLFQTLEALPDKEPEGRLLRPRGCGTVVCYQHFATTKPSLQVTTALDELCAKAMPRCSQSL